VGPTSLETGAQMTERPTRRNSGSIHVLDDIPITLPETILLKRLRLPDVRAIDEIPDPTLRRDIWRSVHRGLELARPRAVARWLELPREAQVVQLDSLQIFESRGMLQALDGCTKVTVIAVTIGDELATEVEKLRDGSLADAYHLDTVGSTLVGAVVDTVAADVSKAIRRAGYHPTELVPADRVEGEDGALDVLLKRCGAEEIGIVAGADGNPLPPQSEVALMGWRDGQDTAL